MLQLIAIISIALLVAADQLIKYIVVNNLTPIGSVTVIPKILELKYIENSGAAFGSLSNNTVILSIFTLVIVIVCLVYLLSGKIKDKFIYICGILVVSGGIGNLIDRIFRGQEIFNGYVVDYINVLFMNFAVFNFADCLITVGCISLAVYIIFKDLFKKKVSKK